MNDLKSDHDVIIEMSVIVRNLEQKVSEHLRVCAKKEEATNNRILALEKMFARWMGASSVVIIALPFIFKWLFV